MNKTRIEYLDYSWNPIAMRCTPVSSGCANCWHLAMAKRLAGNHTIDRDAQRAYSGIDGPSMNYVELEAPLRPRKNERKVDRIGVQFMGDLFHGSLSSDMIRSVLRVIQECSWRKFFILTKRPIRMKEFLESNPPSKNLWPGVSIEDQPTADERIPILLQIPATHRWVSIEPMLGPVDLWPKLESSMIHGKDVDGLNWVVLGCESGPKRRPCKIEWIRDIKNQCVAAHVPFFLKQSNGYLNGRSTVVKMPILDGQEWNEMP